MYENIKSFASDENAPLNVYFAGESVCDEKYLIERSCSDLYAFEYIVEGVGTLEINGQTLYPKKGDIFFITDKSRHRYYSQKKNGWHKYFIGFGGVVADALAENYLPGDTYLFEKCFAEKRFQRIFDIAFNSNDALAAKNELALEIFKLFNFLRDRRASESEDLADRIKRSIENHIEDSFNLDVLCDDMNYSKNHIINLFSQKFDMTPYQYYTSCKINIAKNYLANTNMTISEISNALSYSDQQYFSYCFKKATGFSPRSYRNNTKV